MGFWPTGWNGARNMPNCRGQFTGPIVRAGTTHRIRPTSSIVLVSRCSQASSVQPVDATASSRTQTRRRSWPSRLLIGGRPGATHAVISVVLEHPVGKGRRGGTPATAARLNDDPASPTRRTASVRTADGDGGGTLRDMADSFLPDEPGFAKRSGVRGSRITSGQSVVPGSTDDPESSESSVSSTLTRLPQGAGCYAWSPEFTLGEPNRAHLFFSDPRRARRSPASLSLPPSSCPLRARLLPGDQK